MSPYALRGALLAAHAAILFKIADWSGYRTPAPYPLKWIGVCAIIAAIGLTLAYRSLWALDRPWPWDARLSLQLLGAIIGFWLVGFLQISNFIPSASELMQMLRPLIS